MLPLRLKPAGRFPAEIDHVYGGAPPEAASAWLYAAPAAPLGNGLLVAMIGIGGPASALINPAPAGLPKPVQRSYPGSAGNFAGLLELKLLPTVMSLKATL
jgi:hypothetical protein